MEQISTNIIACLSVPASLTIQPLKSRCISMLDWALPVLIRSRSLHFRRRSATNSPEAVVGDERWRIGHRRRSVCNSNPMEGRFGHQRRRSSANGEGTCGGGAVRLRLCGSDKTRRNSSLRPSAQSMWTATSPTYEGPQNVGRYHYWEKSPPFCFY